ncbi:MAG: polar amino acid transport system permease protein [Kosmotogales bacterium]|nr:polar amino acid transport system permease protein [Kosmotogales bacterium]
MKRAVSLIVVILILGFLLIILYNSVSKVYPFNWKVIQKYWKLFLDGLFTTLTISGIALCFSVIIGFFIALARKSKSYIFQDFGMIYVWFFRNLPLLVIILLIYYGFGSIVNIERFWAGVISLSLFEGAYVGEIIRAGIEAVPPGEVEAGYSLGLKKGQIYYNIILPQAFKISIPPLIGQLVSLVKDSSLVSVIALGDLTMRARQIGNQTLASMESYLVLAAFYLTITSLLSFAGRIIERRFKVS